MAASQTKTALDVMGITEARFKSLYCTGFGRDTVYDIQAIKDALTVIAAQQTQNLKIWDAIGITERTFRRLEDRNQRKLTETWVYLQNPALFDQKRDEQVQADREGKRQDFYAKAGLTEEKFLALDGTAKAAVIKAFADADALKKQASEKKKATVMVGGAFAAALGVTGLSFALSSAQTSSVPNVSFSCQDLTPEQCNERIEKIGGIIRAYKGAPAPEHK